MILIFFYNTIRVDFLKEFFGINLIILVHHIHTHRWWRTGRWRRWRWVFDDLDKQKQQKSVSTKSMEGRVQTHKHTLRPCRDKADGGDS